MCCCWQHAQLYLRCVLLGCSRAPSENKFICSALQCRRRPLRCVALRCAALLSLLLLLPVGQWRARRLLDNLMRAEHTTMASQFDEHKARGNSLLQPLQGRTYLRARDVTRAAHAQANWLIGEGRQREELRRRRRRWRRARVANTDVSKAIGGVVARRPRALSSSSSSSREMTALAA